MATTKIPEQDGKLEECDLVMKGGLTSGVVYPALILELKKSYRFRNIGGTSAGAIAAAATAAAEFGREARGFEELEELQRKLSDGRFLRGLFQPAENMAPVLDLALEVMEKKTKMDKAAALGQKASVPRLVAWAAWRMLRRRWPRIRGDTASHGRRLGWLAAGALTLLPALTWLPFALATGAGLTGLGFPIAFLLLGAALGRVGAVGGALVELVKKDLPDNHFGLCPGRPVVPAGARDDGGGAVRAEALTDWLHARFEAMADKKSLRDEKRSKGPLTFGDLWEGRHGRSKLDPAEVNKPVIDLKMFTSNLSQYQPFVLPFENHCLIFNADEFSTLFPQDVVDHLIKRHDGDDRHDRYRLPDGFHFLPEAKDLPVIVATRMTLSFPVLLSAVPLYTIRPDKLIKNRLGAGESVQINATADLQRNWFSDGGICSNFPIHFFDGWLPRRPAFGVNLTKMPDQALQQANGHSSLMFENIAIAADPKKCSISNETAYGWARDALEEGRQAIYLPKADDWPATEWVNLDGSLFRFLASIFTTAQVYRDNDQAMLPSYRERIVQIRLKDSEGGLNLAMQDETISNMVQKGRDAGMRLRDFEFDVHFWVRFRVLTRQLEMGLKQMRTALESRSFLETLAQPDRVGQYPFPPDFGNDPAQRAQWCQEVVERLNELLALLNTWNQRNPNDLFGVEKLPIPEAALRVMPKV